MHVMRKQSQAGSALFFQAQSALQQLADPQTARILSGFFKTGPGEYGEGDVFRGIRVPDIRQVACQMAEMPLGDAVRLLKSPFHEDRLCALLILARKFERGDEACRKRVYETYVKNTRRINNWDLVDLSAPNIVGAWLLNRDPAPLRRLAASKNLWERRVAMVATHAFIRAQRYDLTLEIAERLLNDSHDLMHKASGWMLREAGKRDVDVLRRFLRRHAGVMPRTMLRYSIERLSADERQKWMAVRSARV